VLNKLEKMEVEFLGSGGVIKVSPEFHKLPVIKLSQVSRKVQEDKAIL
jgi:hypothetical protein